MITKSIRLFSLIACTCVLVHTVNSQTPSARTHKIGLSVTPINRLDIFRFTNLYGASTPSAKTNYSFGIDYYYPINHWIDLETGLQLSHYDMEGSFPNPPFETYTLDLSHLEIPIMGRFYFGNYFFANGGFLMGFDLTKSQYLDNQTGLGAALGLGGKYDIGLFSIFVNPNVRTNALIPFAKERYHERSRFYGIKFGVTYAVNGK